MCFLLCRPQYTVCPLLAIVPIFVRVSQVMSASAASAAAAASFSPVATVQSKSLLRAPSDAPKPASPFLLAPNDWILPPAMRIALLFFYERPASQPAETFLPEAKLRASLERLLRFYPILDA